MALSGLSSRAVQGMFYEVLQQDAGLSFLDDISAYFRSNQESEEYAWIGQVPQLRKWRGGREARGFTDQKITVINERFEAAVEIPIPWFERDKTDQARVRIGELAQRANAHFWKILAELMVTGETALAYDGKYFWDSDHEEGDSGSQSNLVTYDISDGPASLTGTTTDPSAEDAAGAMLKGVQALIALKDDKGEFCNELYKDFLAIVPTTFMRAFMEALGSQIVGAGRGNPLIAAGSVGGYNFKVQASPRLNSTWTTKFPLFITQGLQKPMIRQEEKPITLRVLDDPNCEHCIKNDTNFYGVDTRRQVAFGDFKKSVLVAFSA